MAEAGFKRVSAALATLPQRYGRVTTRRAYLPQIDGLRLLALLPVLVWHAGLRADRMVHTAHRSLIWGHILPDGECGVDLFFAISGLIIALPFFGRTDDQYSHLGRFYRRRLTRLEPPYVLCLLICFALLSVSHYAPSNGLRFSSSNAPLWQSLLASLFYMHGIVFNSQPRLNPPLWSLEVEAQFYLLAPLIIFPYLRIRHLFIPFTAVMTLAAMVLATYFDTNRYFGQVQGKTLLNYLPFFMVGIACTKLISLPPAERRRGAGMLGLIAFVVLWISGHDQAYQAFWPVLGRDLLRLVCIYAILFAAIRSPRVGDALSYPWVTLVGAMCYSVYLTHVPLMQGVGEVLGRLVPGSSEVAALLTALGVLIPLSLLVGFGYYLLIERPCMDPAWPRRLIPGRPPK